MQLQLFTIPADPVCKEMQTFKDFLKTVNVVQLVPAFVQAEKPYWSFAVAFEPRVETQAGSFDSVVKQNEKTSLTAEEKIIFEALRAWRSETAKAELLPYYMICSNRELAALAVFKPISVEELRQVRGFGDRRIARYGEQIIEVLAGV